MILFEKDRSVVVQSVMLNVGLIVDSNKIFFLRSEAQGHGANQLCITTKIYGPKATHHKKYLTMKLEVNHFLFRLTQNRVRLTVASKFVEVKTHSI